MRRLRSFPIADEVVFYRWVRPHVVDERFAYIGPLSILVKCSNYRFKALITYTQLIVKLVFKS
jgi:hypothetical protein